MCSEQNTTGQYKQTGNQWEIMRNIVYQTVDHIHIINDNDNNNNGSTKTTTSQTTKATTQRTKNNKTQHDNGNIHNTHTTIHPTVAYFDYSKTPSLSL